MEDKPDTSFDVMAYVRRVRDQNYELTKDMTVDEKVAFYKDSSEAAMRSLGLASDGSKLAEHEATAA
jgi:hypothetical protein